MAADIVETDEDDNEDREDNKQPLLATTAKNVVQCNEEFSVWIQSTFSSGQIDMQDTWKRLYRSCQSCKRIRFSINRVILSPPFLP